MEGSQKERVETTRDEDKGTTGVRGDGVYPRKVSPLLPSIVGLGGRKLNDSLFFFLGKSERWS